MFPIIARTALLLSAACAFSLPAFAAESLKTNTPPRYPLFFVTDRTPIVKHGVTTFSKDRSSKLSFGKILTTANSNDFDPAKMQVFATQSEFLKDLKTTAPDLAVFVHGYRKDFNGSIDFGMKMSEHMDRPLVVFSWPSKNSYFAYMKDECTAEWSAHQLSQVLGDMGDTIGYRNISLLSHSLGSRMMQWALRDLDSERRPSEKFAASLYFSPDVDRDTFIQNAPLLKRTCGDNQLFLGRADTRLKISKLLHGGPRLGRPEYDKTQSDLFNTFRCQTFLRNHQIPYDVVADTVRQIPRIEGTKITASTNTVQTVP